MSFRPLTDTVPEPSRAFRHFTNRVDEQDTFRRCVEQKADGTLPVLMFYGVGGTGKSWLLQKLQQNLDGEIPSARISFEPTSSSHAYSTDFARALSAFRHQIGDVFCPRFDVAYAWLRH